MRIKICGITDSATASTIANLGGDTLGFVCVPQSSRYVSILTIAEIINSIPEEISTVGVFVNTPIAEIIQIVAKTGLTAIQLHGEETLETCVKLREILPNREIIKAFRVKNRESLANIADYYPMVDTLLLDAYQPNVYGGTGKTLNWQELADFRPPRPWLLAGGLNADNVIEAINLTNCDGIDVSSGLELTPGQKDIAKVTQLFQALDKLGRI